MQNLDITVKFEVNEKDLTNRRNFDAVCGAVQLYEQAHQFGRVTHECVMEQMQEEIMDFATEALCKLTFTDIVDFRKLYVAKVIDLIEQEIEDDRTERQINGGTYFAKGIY